MTSSSYTLTGRRIGAVLNTASGSCTAESVDEMRELLAEHGLTPVDLWCGDSKELEANFKTADTAKLDILIVLGGDGTIRTAAARSRTDGPLLIPLPGGTMNVLPRALYGDGSWRDILRAILARPVVQEISGGAANGEHFFISAICGSPALWAHAREAMRDGNLERVMDESKAALDALFSEKVNYHFDEMHEGTAEALTVSCPLVSSSLEADRKVLEAAIIDVNHAGDLLSLATAAAFGAWKDDQNVAIVRTPHVVISAERSVPVILDGESVSLGSTVEIVFVPHAFTALVPQPDEVLS